MTYKHLALAVIAIFLLLPGRSAVAAQSTNSAPQNLRQSIGIVLNEPEEETAKQLRSFGLFFSRMGIRTASRGLTQLARPSFGSGVVVEVDGLPYLMTNSHVVGISEKVSVLFIQDKDTIRIDDCACIYNDAARDIAIVSLPQMDEIVPLSLEYAALAEGTIVFSAGYPGLGGTPSWQFGQGIVSNARLEWPDAPFAYLQHTAQVDKGSSGSPVLVNQNGTYYVVGISTMKASDREAVGIAIPAQRLLDSFGMVGEDMTDIWRKAFDTLSVEDYEYMYQRVPDSILNLQDSLFYRGEILHAFALVPEYAATHDLVKKSKNRNAYTVEKRYDALKAAENKDDNSTTKGAKGKTTAASNKTQTKKNKEFGINDDLDFVRFMQANGVLFAPFPTSFQAGIGYRNAFANYLRLGADFSYSSLPMEWTGASKNTGAFDVAIVFGAQVPVNLGPVVLIPYLTPDVGPSFQFNNGFGVGMTFGGHVGTDIGFPLNSAMFYLGVDYTLLGYYRFMNSSNGVNLGHGVGFHIGFAF